MALGGAVATQLTTPETRTISVFVASRDVTKDTKWDALSLTDAGVDARGTASIRLEKKLSELPEIRSLSKVEIYDHDRGDITWAGYVDSRHPIKVPGYSHTQVGATFIGSLLDSSYIAFEDRPAESMQARLGFFWGYYAGSHLSGDFSKVASIGGTLPAASYAGISLRTVIEQVIAQASSSADYYVDAAGRLHVFTSEANAAPFDIDADAPGAGEIAPHDLDIDYDTGPSYANRVYIQGATPSASGFFQDAAAISDANGLVVTAEMKAPDVETAAMATALANMYLGKVSSGKARGTFSVTSPDVGYRAGQTLLVTSADHDVAAETFGIARVTTTVARPGTALLLAQRVEFGAASVFGGPGGARMQRDSLGSGQLVSGQLGGASNVYVTADGLSVTDGTRVRAHIGRLADGTFGITITDSSGNVLIDGQKIQLARSEGTLPAGVKLGINQTTITASGVVVNDGTRDRVILGDI